jgi:hypothetical protein
MTVFFSYYAVLLACSVLGMVLNYLKGLPFPSVSFSALLVMLPLLMIATGLMAEHSEMDMVNLTKALTLLFFSVAVMSTLTVVFSTRLDMVPNLVVCCIIFFLGMISSYLFGGEASSPLTAIFFYICHALLPNWQFFWLADALAANQPIGLEYIFMTAVYTLFYIILCSIWAVTLFMNCELAKESR